MKYHRIVVTRHSAPDVLQVVEEDLPEPGPGEARVRVLAAGGGAHPLVEAARAHELLERGGYAGKVVLVSSA